MHGLMIKRDETHIYIEIPRDQKHITLAHDMLNLLGKDGAPEVVIKTEKGTLRIPDPVEVMVDERVKVEGTKPPAKKTSVKVATDTPIVKKTRTITLREGVLNDLLKLERVNKDTALPVLREWYSHLRDSSLVIYANEYIRYMRESNTIDGMGRVLSNNSKENKPKENPSADPVPIKESDEVEDVEPDLIHPIRKDLTVVTVKGKVEIYLEPLNKLLKFERIDDTTLQMVLVTYYDAPRVSFMVAIIETWKEFLQEEGYIDSMGKPTCKEVEL